MASPEHTPNGAAAPRAGERSNSHEPPTFTRLGTLAELTLGPPGLGTDDGFMNGGFNGDVGGSIGP